jgi:excisionase family DNA binding protein
MRTLDLDELTGTEEAAPVLGKSDRTVRRWCGDGTLPAVRISAGWVLRRADMEALAAERNRPVSHATLGTHATPGRQARP